MRKRNTMIESYGLLTMEDEFEMLVGDNQKKLQDYLSDDESQKELAIRCAGLVESKDVDSGEVREVLVMIDNSDVAWATISPTFIDSFLTMSHWLAAHEMAPQSVMVERRMGKRGRSFLICGIGKYEKVSE